MSDAPERIWADPEGHDFDEVDLGVGNTEYIRKDLAAPTVKPLVWRDAKVSDNGERETANCLVGLYEAIRWSSGDYGGTLAHHPDEKGKKFGGCFSLNEAKAACQADYERRILLALENNT